MSLRNPKVSKTDKDKAIKKINTLQNKYKKLIQSINYSDFNYDRDIFGQLNKIVSEPINEFEELKKEVSQLQFLRWKPRFKEFLIVKNSNYKGKTVETPKFRFTLIEVTIGTKIKDRIRFELVTNSITTFKKEFMKKFPI
ncbi:MAG: hypothetical protein ACFFG0_20755 [Candidatus Thorarchaeota archaeon]